MLALLIGGGWPIGRVMGRRKAKCREATHLSAGSRQRLARDEKARQASDV